jgi:hypothetical protein
MIPFRAKCFVWIFVITQQRKFYNTRSAKQLTISFFIRSRSFSHHSLQLLCLVWSPPVFHPWYIVQLLQRQLGTHSGTPRFHWYRKISSQVFCVWFWMNVGSLLSVLESVFCQCQHEWISKSLLITWSLFPGWQHYHIKTLDYYLQGLVWHDRT